MRTRIGILLVAGVASVGSVAWVFRPANSTPADAGPLVVAPEHLDRGAIWESPSHTIELPVENRSAEPVQVTGWARSCSCLSVEPERFTLAPGETRTVRTELILTARGSGPEEEFEVYLTAMSGERAVSSRWALRGQVRSPLPAAPREIDFGLISDLATDVAPNVFEVEPPVPLECVTAVVEPPIATATVTPLDGSGRVRVTVRPVLPVPPGDQRATLRLLPVRVGGEALPPREVRIVCQGGTDVQPNPPRLLLGSIPDGDTATAEVAFRSLTGRPFEIEPVSPGPAGVTIARRESSDGPAFGITVRGVAGSQVVPVEFRVRQQSRPDYTVRAEAVYHGVAR
jgi:hypothetical protein